MNIQTKKGHYDIKLTQERIGEDFLKAFALARRSATKELQLFVWLREGNNCEEWVIQQITLDPKMKKNMQMAIDLKLPQLIKEIETSKYIQERITELENNVENNVEYTGKDGLTDDRDQNESLRDNRHKGLIQLLFSANRQGADFQLDQLLLTYEKEDIKDALNQKETEKEALEKKLVTKEKIMETMKKDHLKVVNSFEILKKEHKELLKNKDQIDGSGLAIANNQLKQEVTSLQKELQNIKEASVPKSHYDTLKDNYLTLNDKNKELISMNKQLNTQIHQLNSQIQQLNSQLEAFTQTELEKETLMFKELEKYLLKQGLTDQLTQLVYPYFGQENLSNSRIKKQQSDDSTTKTDLHKTTALIMETKAECPTATLIPTANPMPQVRLSENQRIGYCQIKSTGHVLHLADHFEVTISNIPDNILIGENQFVQVDEKGQFIKNYPQIHENGTNDYQIKGFIEKEGQIHGITSTGRVHRTYKAISFHKDLFLKSALVRNQKAYLVQRTIGEIAGALATDIATDQECFVALTEAMKQAGQSFYSDTIVFMKGEQLVNKLMSYKFYTAAPSYKGSEIGVARVKDGQYFFERLNGERVRIMLEMEDDEITDGDIVSIDSYNHLIGKKKASDHNKKTIEQRVKQHAIEEADTDLIAEENKLAILSDSVGIKFLIVGDKGQQLKYKLAFKKAGYDTEVISAFEQWKKIDMEARKVDFILLASDCASHSNYHMLKRHHSDKLRMANHSGVKNLLNVANAICKSVSMAI